MVTDEFLIALLVGPVLALPYVAYARRGRRSAVSFGVGLIIAALIYVVFALVAFNWQAVLIEAGGVVLFGTIAALGLRWSPHWLAAGWLVHIGWDLLLHPVAFSEYAPWWYPAACVGFDALVAGFILATFWDDGQDDGI